MNGVRQSWLVALRELRERSRSRAFRVSLVVMILVVVAVIVLPAVLEGSGGTRRIGLTGEIPAELRETIERQGGAVGIEARVRRYDTRTGGEKAVRDGDIDVLVVDARRLEWRRRPDEQVQAVVIGAIQLMAVRERAAAAGLTPDALQAMIAPVPIENVELGRVAGRSSDDETAALVMTVLLLMAIATYGVMVLSGVVEEKASRVVEVLLARMPARNLLAGKVAGIGLLGLGQIAVTAVAALIAVAAVKSFDVPAIRGAVIAWVVVWFILGYALYAMAYGALGSLASRTEDAQSVAGPVQVVLVVSYFVSFAAIGSAGTTWARLVSFFPATAPLAMPNRIAMGTAAWWEPFAAAVVTLAAVAGLVVFAGRVYTNAILRSGPTIKLRDAWRGTRKSGPSAAGTGTHRAGVWRRNARVPGEEQPMTKTREAAERWLSALLITIGAGSGVAVGLLARDVILGVGAGAGFYAVASRIAKAWTGNTHRSIHQ